MKSGLSFSFVLKNLWARRLTTTLTVLGMALVVFVFACVLMMTEGLRQTMAGTGAYDNVVLIRKGSQTEVQSSVTREQARLVSILPGLATDSQGNSRTVAESLVLINLPRTGGEGNANVVVRGTSAAGIGMRPQIKLISGRLFEAGASEVIVGEGLTRGRLGIQLGDMLNFGARQWRVVGVFSADRSGFESELHADRDQIMQAFRRQVFSSVVVSLENTGTFSRFDQAVGQQPSLNFDVQRESVFYANQSEKMANFIEILGTSIAMIFSLGAMIGATITMYSSVANRVREIGTLRALGFQRGNILSVFLAEAISLGLIAGLLGIFCAFWMQRLEISTTNVQTFSEVVFKLTMTPAVGVQVLLFSLVMGAVGGLLPAYRASRMEIVDALRNG
ncbi:ABC-type lipoprotein release transport system permease subunit [Limnobacter thiooxidans]|uniref:ABC transporter permease n=1 Tax=Limnobacter thiooxidans TaxID=131080 RepID=A0AA86MF10_9BURK|nr:ABC-type lipoprotein release transport system permease subunit [Limnobacter thiooxidans]BET26620.1 ABC transporter permease [Limnobacter thiooxidans]